MARGDSARSPRGEITLREREEPDGRTTIELRVNGIFVMDTEETSSERALARAALDVSGIRRARVLVGGLGLGFTLAELQHDPGVEAITIVEIEPAVVEWHRSDRIPGGAALLADPRMTVIVGDVADVIVDSEQDFDLILLDVDNGPRYLVYEHNAALYRTELLRAARRALASGGVLCIWAANESDDLADAMATVFGSVEAHRYPVRLQDREEHYLLYLARLVSTT